MHIIKSLVSIAAASLLISACSPEVPSGQDEDYTPGGLSESEYDNLTNEQKYQVSNKLLGTMFKGMPVSEFYDLSRGMQNTALKQGDDFLANTKSALRDEMTASERRAYDVIIDGYSASTGNSSDNISRKYSFDSDRPKQLPLTRMYEYPVSKDMFDHWIAYVLSNTILFSPAEEIDSADILDVQKVYNKLIADLRENKGVREIISRHQQSQENWRRFRSPEDNTREMIEIYLGLFDRDEDVPRAAKACQDLYLTDENNGYELVSTGFMNTEPQYVLDTFVTSCNDFYNVIAGHPLVIPRVTTVLVEYFFFTRTGDERAKIVETIVSANPETFQQIFKSILFSKEYLLSTERPKSIEENFFSVAHQSKWEPFSTVFRNMTSDTNGMSFKQMGWPVMSLKLGRFTGVPTNAFSFANYHSTLHQNLMLDNGRWDEGLGVRQRSSGIPNQANDVTPHPGAEPAHPGGGASTAALDAYNLALGQYQAQLEAHNISKSVFDVRNANYQKEVARFNAVRALSMNEFIDYVFLDGIARKASAGEKTDLIAHFSNRSYLTTDADGNQIVRTDRLDDAAEDMLDYLARLTEQYYFKAIN